MPMTLKELSDILGLSQTTVSRALNGYPEDNEATRDRVRRVAEQQNYRPNKRASSLATGKTNTIGHIVPMDSQHEVVNPIFGEFIAGASQTYNQNGYEMLLSVADKRGEEEFYRGIVAKRSVDGVVIQMPRRDDSRIELLQQLGIPFVLHGRVSGLESRYAWIDINNRGAVYQATRLLLDLGHRRIALLNGNEELNFAWERRQGYMQALSEHGLGVDPDIMSSAELTETHGYREANRMLAQAQPPTAFFASSYIVALGISRAINEAGLVMGKQVSVVIHDDELSYFDNSGDIPLFTGTRSSVRVAGAQAAQMLLDMINNPTIAPPTRLLETHLTIGRSTGPAPTNPG